MVWLINALNGKILANFIGHEEEVISAKFSIEDKGKHIISASADKTIRVWSPMTQSLVTVIKSYGQHVKSHGGKKMFHEKPILCFALHPDIPVVISGDEEGKVYVS